MKSYTDYNFLHEAILQEDIYLDNITDTTFQFYIKAIVPLEKEFLTIAPINRSNIANSDQRWLTNTSNFVTSYSTIGLKIPRYLMYSNSNDNIIHSGTVFLVGFIGGNINRCIIVGRDD